MSSIAVSVWDTRDPGVMWITIGSGARDRIMKTVDFVWQRGGTPAFKINGVDYDYNEGLKILRRSWAIN